MIYHRKCALLGCDNEFDTFKPNKTFCCNDHYRRNNSIRSAANEKQNKIERPGRYHCVTCGKKVMKYHHLRCAKCWDKIRKEGTEDTLAMEHRVIA